MVKVQSPASATVINAISMGKGSAFGIQLYVTADVSIINKPTDKDIDYVCKSCDDPNMDVTLMNLCVEKVYAKLSKHPKFNIKNIFLDVKTVSDIPTGSGLSSSSAASNSIVYATMLTLLNEANLTFEDVNITFEDIIDIGIDASLDCGVSKTGAFDDASASFYGGWKITDNYNRKILYDNVMPYEKILIYMPNKSSHTAQSDVMAMKILAPYVKIAFEYAKNKNIETALTLNGFLYCAALDFDTQITMDALKAGANAAGLSGTGSAYTILVDEDKLDSVKDALKKYPGKLIETKSDNKGSVVL